MFSMWSCQLYTVALIAHQLPCPPTPLLCKSKVSFAYFMFTNFPANKCWEKINTKQDYDNGGVIVRVREFPLQQAGGSTCSRKMQYNISKYILQSLQTLI